MAHDYGVPEICAKIVCKHTSSYLRGTTKAATFTLDCERDRTFEKRIFLSYDYVFNCVLCGYSYVLF